MRQLLPPSVSSAHYKARVFLNRTLKHELSEFFNATN